MPLNRFLLFCSLLALSSCDEPRKVNQAQALPRAICDKAKQAVVNLTLDGLILEKPAEGQIPQAIWLRLSRMGKDGVLTSIALNATCEGGAQLEQQVTLRDESGNVLARRIVQTSYSVGEALVD
jgi:hypothetical protein